MGFEQEPQFKKSNKSRKDSFRTLVILFFLVLVGAIVFFAFNDKISITGNFVKLMGVDEEKAFDILARLEEVNGTFEIKQNIEQIRLELKDTGSVLVVDGGVGISLEGISNPVIILGGFDGAINLDKNSIISISGRVEKLSVNQIPLFAEGKSIKILLNESAAYELISLSEVYVREYRGNAIDRIEAKGKSFFDLDGEEVEIKKFKGNLSFGEIGSLGIKERGIIFEGIAEDLEIKGEFDINLKN